MSKGSEFVPVLAVGIIILGVLFLFFGGGLIFPSAPSGKYATIEEFPEEAVTEDLGWIGQAEQQIKHVLLDRDFTVSYVPSEQNAVDLKNLTVSSGLLSSEDKKLSFSAKGVIETAKISFDVKDTNLYGPLIIVLNGAVLYENLSLAGRHEVEFNTSLLAEENVLEIRAGSSGWKFWAPTVYIMDFKVVLGTLDLKTKTYEFSLGDEALALSGARFSAYGIKQGTGNLIAKVNGVEIYRGNKINILQDFSFRDTNLKSGKNTVELLAEQNTKYDLKEAELIIFYQPVYKSKIFWYNLTNSEYSTLNNRNLTLKFYIERIAGDVVSIPIRTEDGSGRTHTIIPQGILRAGQFYSVLLTKNELYTGSNKIEFSASGTGGILITNITIT